MARDPVPDLPTERLRLRAMRPGDAPDFHTAYGDAESMRFWNHGPSRDVARTEKYIAGWSRPSAQGWMLWAIADAVTDRCLGMINYHGRELGNRRAEVGYILTPAARGQGYAAEALTAVVAHMHNTLAIHRIEALIEPANTASRRLVERLGFTLEAPLLRDRLRVDGIHRDATLYARLAGTA